MRLLFSLFLLFPSILFTQTTWAQTYELSNASVFNSISQNSVSNLEVYGDSVWIGPRLQFNLDYSNDWVFPEGLDSIRIGNGRVYSMKLGKDTILAGLGETIQVNGSPSDAGYGFYFSSDGGINWEFYDFPLDLPEDTRYRYGNNDISKLPVIVRGQSPPYDIDFKGEVISVAAWASGFIRSLDGGATWNRIILPPSRFDSLSPERTYTFTFDPRNDNNFLGFSTLIDDENNIWIGTAGGLNVSSNAYFTTPDQVRWFHTSYNDTRTDGLPGNWIIHLVQQPGTKRIWMTNWIAQAGEKFAISYTEDGGRTFSAFLFGEKIYDIGFFNDAIVATGDNGLFISTNDGSSWNQLRTVQSPNSRLKENTIFYSVDANEERIWVGTSDGLLTSTDLKNWDIIRVNVPLSGGNQFDPDARTVSSYAYPNPFSPREHTVIRIRYDVATAASVKVTLLDFGMNTIRVLQNGQLAGGSYEFTWDGKDEAGRRVANGPVFYIIEDGDTTVKGKFLVLN